VDALELEATDEALACRPPTPIPDLDMAIGARRPRGLHYSWIASSGALGRPVAWDNDAFTELQTFYAELSPPSRKPEESRMKGNESGTNECDGHDR